MITRDRHCCRCLHCYRCFVTVGVCCSAFIAPRGNKYRQIVGICTSRSCRVCCCIFRRVGCFILSIIATCCKCAAIARSCCSHVCNSSSIRPQVSAVSWRQSAALFAGLPPSTAHHAHHLQASDPLLWAAIERHEGPIHMATEKHGTRR